MNKLFCLLLTVCTCFLTSVAASFSTSPRLLTRSAKDVKIIFNANEYGNASLKNASKLYAHIGVTLESAPSTWTYVVGSWTSNEAKKQFTQTSTAGVWELNIGDINSYFGITDNIKVAKIAVIARTENGGAQTSDFFLDVQPDGYCMALTHNASNLIIDSPTTITFDVDVSEASTITLSVNNQVVANASNALTLSKAYTFADKGSFYTVTATATNGKETLEQSLSVAYPQPSAAKDYPGGIPRQGAVRNSDGTVTFCLAAPQKQSVILVPSWDNYQMLDRNVMWYQDYEGYRYFWITTTKPLDNYTYYPYYYLVDGKTKVADPYAKLVLDCYSDKYLPSSVWPEMPKYPYDKFDDTMLAVYYGCIDDYNWDSATLNFQTPDHSSLTIYEILLRDFTGDGSDQNGSSYGTFRTALPKIEYLVSLGVNAVELMPVMEFNGNSSWGYNNNFYMALDKAYGSPRHMRDFIAECHRHGIAVILDIVFNQSDGLHPWYQMYSIDNNPFYNKNAPHSYSVLNDWNQDCPLVMNHWKDVLTYWLTAYKVDGFRFDLVKGLGNNSSYGSGTDGYNASRVARMKELNDAMKAVKPDVIHINELLGGNQEENANGANGQMGWNKVWYGASQYAMGFASGMNETANFYAKNAGKNLGTTVDYAESHDEPRIANKAKKSGSTTIKYDGSSTPRPAAINRLGAVAAQMLLSPGAKMIWQFGESAADDDQGSDLDKLRAIAPKWDEMEVPNRAALVEMYRQLCNLRTKNPEMFSTSGSTTCEMKGFSSDLETVRTIRLTNGNSEIIGFFNPSLSNTKTVTANAARLSASNCQLITSSFGHNVTLTGSGVVSVSLPSNGFAVFATADVADVEKIESDLLGSSDVVVYGDFGRIVIEGEYTTAEVFDMQGRTYRSLDVAPGLYVVRVDSVPFKVLVK